MGKLKPDKLADYARRGREELIRVARQGGFIYYGRLMERLQGPGRGYIGQALEEVAEREFRDRPVRNCH